MAVQKPVHLLFDLSQRLWRVGNVAPYVWTAYKATKSSKSSGSKWRSSNRLVSKIFIGSKFLLVGRSSLRPA
jgi:hypothetical protein